MVLNKNNLTFFESDLRDLKRLNLYRRLRIQNQFKWKVSSKKEISITDFATNDYLGLSKDKKLLNFFRTSYFSSVSQCSSRLISGHTVLFEKLEGILAHHRHTEAALVYPTGYMANLGTISCIANNETTIFSDELNHASIIDACRLSRARVEVFSHNDIFDLENKIKNNRSKRKAIVTEGIFSMNGDMAKLDAISEISNRYECILIVDDAHGDFIIGEKSKGEYGGTPSYFSVENEVDIHISSLSKGLGCFGGYVACSDLLRKYLINKSRAFIFTSALPDIFCELASRAAFLAKRGNRQTKLQHNLNYFEEKSKNYSLPGLKITKDSPIIPLVLGAEEKCLSISDSLLKKGYFVQPIRYPTVKHNEAQLRISISALHTFKQISGLLSILDLLLNQNIS